MITYSNNIPDVETYHDLRRSVDWAVFLVIGAVINLMDN